MRKLFYALLIINISLMSFYIGIGLSYIENMGRRETPIEEGIDIDPFLHINGMDSYYNIDNIM